MKVRKRPLSVTTPLFALIVQACGPIGGAQRPDGSGPGTDGGDTPAASVVGASGGLVSLPDGASVQIPPGALSADTMITIVTSDAPPPPGAVGRAYLFGPEGTTFEQPVTITLPYSTTALPAGMTQNDVVIQTAPAGSTSFASLATTGVEAGIVRAQASHFSVFVPVVPTEPCAPCGGTCVDLSTDNDNCGACGAACRTNAPSTAQCMRGRCAVTLFHTDVTSPITYDYKDIAVSQGNAYWLDMESYGPNVGHIKPFMQQVPIDGGPVSMTTDQGDPYSDTAFLAADATNLYWSDGSGLIAMPLGGGPQTVLAHENTDVGSVGGIAVDGSYLYSVDNFVGLARVPIDGTAPLTQLVPPVANANDTGLMMDTTNFYWLACGGGATPCAAYGVPRAGGASFPIAPSLPSIALLDTTVGGGRLWAIPSGSRVVASVPVTGGATEIDYTAPATAPEPYLIVSDGTNVYWFEAAALMRMSVNGGAPTTLFEFIDPYGMANAGGIAVDATSVYWTMRENGGGNSYSIMRLTPK
jgi:Stigma-specific protein, Stig1/ZU5 domain